MNWLDRPWEDFSFSEPCLCVINVFRSSFTCYSYRFVTYRRKHESLSQTIQDEWSFTTKKCEMVIMFCKRQMSVGVVRGIDCFVYTMTSLNMSSRSNFETLRLAPRFSLPFLSLIFMALRAQFTWYSEERASRQEQFEWCRLKCVGEITKFLKVCFFFVSAHELSYLLFENSLSTLWQGTVK